MKAGLGTTGLSVLGLNKLFGVSRPGIETGEYSPGKVEDEEVEIFLKYGGEFSGVKPQLKPGRTHHGSI